MLRQNFMWPSLSAMASGGRLISTDRLLSRSGFAKNAFYLGTFFTGHGGVAALVLVVPTVSTCFYDTFIAGDGTLTPQGRKSVVDVVKVAV